MINRNKNPRYLALRVLIDIWSEEAKPKDAIERYGRVIERRDRSFMHELVYGVLRKRDYLDWCLSPFLRNPEGLKDKTLNNLRLGVYQALFMRVPLWAAVNETIEIEKITGRQTALLNAVLRKVTSGKSCPPLPDDPVRSIAIRTSHPEWLVERWVGRFGPEEAEALASANNMIPPLTVRISSADHDDILKRLSAMEVEYEPAEYSPAGLKIRGSYDFDHIRELLGDLFIQDEAAQLITMLLDPRQDERILDACAAPGGKTVHIAEITGGNDRIYAVERNSARLKLLQQNLERHGITDVEVIHGDLEELDEEVSFDRILLDAPCSSLGVIRRNPDVRYRHNEESLQGLHIKQVRLLSSAAGHLKKGGRMVYSVCSTEPDEGEDVIEEFLNKYRDFFIIKADDPGIETEWIRRLTSGRDLTAKGGGDFLRTYPHRDDMDGFFAAVLSRR